MKNKNVLPILALVFGALAVLMFIICPVVTMKVGGQTYGDKGLEAIQGKEGMKATPLLIVPLVLAIVGIVLVAVSMKGNKKLAMAAGVCFVVAAVFFFLTRTFYVSANKDLLVMGMDELVKLGGGAIYAGVMCVASGVLSLVSGAKK